jgi:hypothetical protein
MRPALPVRATLGVKLALVVFSIVAGALALVYLLVVPRLENRLVDAKIDQLRNADVRVVGELGRTGGDFGKVDNTVTFAATNLNARVVVFDRLGARGLRAIADSHVVQAGDVARESIAPRVVATGGPVSGRIERGEREFAE